ncbi:membrane protein [Bacillus mycoides]|uniref:Membrane protein n=2 Tax=Bacillus mycoides TaxID=1405 RepID=A0A1E8B4K9_BACMY|nr:membrane protein [Bacillus mycoides]OFD75584.1 membrane protein [Bacillus mycoides]OFD77472.1 membrane protein [Bacillus mycoides]
MRCIMDKYNGNNIDDCMRILIPFDVRNIVGAFVWVIMNVLLLIILFIFPPYNIYSYVALPFYVMCNLWGIWVSIYKPRQPQLQHLLYSGFVALSISFCSFIAVQKLAYEFVEIESPLFFILSLIAYSLIVYKSELFWIKYFTDRLRGTTNQGVKIPRIVFFSSLGYIIGQVSIGILSQKAMAIVLIVIFSFISVVFLGLSTHLYFYFDFKKQGITSEHLKKIYSQKKPKLSRKERRQSTATSGHVNIPHSQKKPKLIRKEKRQ